jgi:hypothetical protein
MPVVSQPSLADEARHLHASLFGRAIDPAVAARYEQAHRELGLESEPSAVAAAVVARRLDAEAVEFALRRRGVGRELTRKMQLLCYLAEVRSEYLGEFVNLRPSRAGAAAALAAATIRSAWKLAKGTFLVRRHGLV